MNMFVFLYFKGFAAVPKEDIRQIGDYPDLPAISAQKKCPDLYWDPQDRRNFGEPVRIL